MCKDKKNDIEEKEKVMANICVELLLLLCFHKSSASLRKRERKKTVFGKYKQKIDVLWTCHCYHCCFHFEWTGSPLWALFAFPIDRLLFSLLTAAACRIVVLTFFLYFFFWFPFLFLSPLSSPLLHWTRQSQLLDSNRVDIGKELGNVNASAAIIGQFGIESSRWR